MEAVVMQSILDESAATGSIDGMSAADLQAAMSVVLSGGEVGEVEASASAAASELLLSALGAASPSSPPFLFNTSIPVVAGAEARRAVTIALETSEEDELEGSGRLLPPALPLTFEALDSLQEHLKRTAP
jgi:hypothetical protein